MFCFTLESGVWSRVSLYFQDPSPLNQIPHRSFFPLIASLIPFFCPSPEWILRRSVFVCRVLPFERNIVEAFRAMFCEVVVSPTWKGLAYAGANASSSVNTEPVSHSYHFEVICWKSKNPPRRGRGQATSRNPHTPESAREAPWDTYALDWSSRRNRPFRLAASSFNQEYSNKVELIQLNPV